MGEQASCCRRGLFCGQVVSGQDSDVGVENADFGGSLILT